jgi:hypothetical protein
MTLVYLALMGLFFMAPVILILIVGTLLQTRRERASSEQFALRAYERDAQQLARRANFANEQITGLFARAHAQMRRAASR